MMIMMIMMMMMMVTWNYTDCNGSLVFSLPCSISSLRTGNTDSEPCTTTTATHSPKNPVLNPKP